jgi:DNA topoisomerase VI subunit B
MNNRRPAPTLQRVAFKTSRLAEFCGEKELTAQTGHPSEDWPLVILKELVDNALDAAEEAEIAPEIDIKVSTERGEIVITDNGPGLPADTLKGILDYTSRVSSREAYVSPSRGQQGNALKTIVAMPFALDGNRGVTIVEAHGAAHRIVFEMDPVRREPRILTEISPSLVQKGTRVTVRWPQKAYAICSKRRRAVLYK